jgi:hypothetical protein
MSSASVGEILNFWFGPYANAGEPDDAGTIVVNVRNSI